jgi:hypothetical protein
MNTFETRAEAIKEAAYNAAVLEDTKFVSSRYIYRTPGGRYYEWPYDVEHDYTDTLVGIYRFDTGFESFTGR